MEERKVLTQEEFDKKVSEAILQYQETQKYKKEKGGLISTPCCSFYTYIIDGIVVDYERLGDRCSLYFHNCNISSIKFNSDPINGWLCVSSTNLHFVNCSVYKLNIECFVNHVLFYHCLIKDYKCISDYDRPPYCPYEFRECVFPIKPPMICDVDRDIIAYKKCWLGQKIKKPCIVKLLIPKDSRKVSAFISDRYPVKCRCDKAKVLGIYRLNGLKYLSIKEAQSLRYSKAYPMCHAEEGDFIYKVGEWVYPDSFDDNRWNPCSHGIHFFMTFKEAKEFEF